MTISTHILNTPTVHGLINSVDIVPIQERINHFPKTRYYGSKRKLLNWIHDCLKVKDFDTVLDAFGGTGIVSLLFKSMGKTVTYCDAFHFNQHVSKTILSDSIPVNREDFGLFINSSIPKKGKIADIFKNMYFTSFENRWLDGFMLQLISAKISEEAKSLYFYALFQACLQKRPFNIFHRANLNIRLNKSATRSFGNLTTWNKDFSTLMLKAYDDIYNSKFISNGKTRIAKPISATNMKPVYDLVYIDPPYVSNSNKSNFDDYWKKYHFLEGLSRYDDWENHINFDSPIMELNKPKKFTNWNSKSTFRPNLFKLIEKHRESIVALSYLSNAYPSEDEIYKHFKSLFKKVTVHSKCHAHALSKSTKRELIFIGDPI